jgi:hypothetical protein
MVVDDLNMFGTGIGPAEADAVLIVDPDRVLPGPIALELLEAQAWKRERLQGHGRVQAIQALGALLVEARWQRSSCCLGVLTVEDVFGALVLERDDQACRLPLEAAVLTLHAKHN